MKIDRLIAITMYLLNREIVSASALAKRFNVSKRTIQRDIDTLNQAGIPIVSTYGTDGGYQIMDGFKLTKQIADADDYLNILIALKGFCTAYDDDKIKKTLEKAIYTMQAGEQKLFIDFTVAQEGIPGKDQLRVIEKAIADKTLLRIKYSDAEQRRSTRLIEPLALSFQWYTWYLFAYCREKKDYRLFKIQRIVCCETEFGSFSMEHGDIEQLMKEKSLIHDKKGYLNIRLLCKKEVRQQVFEYLSNNVVEEYENGDFIVAMNVPFERMWFSLLLGFGDKVQVLEPEKLKEQLKQAAKEVLSLY